VSAAPAPVSKTAAPIVTALASPKAETRLTLQLVIERNSKFVRGMAKARLWIEDFCLSEYAALPQSAAHPLRTRHAVSAWGGA
jgi:hypothetical protein